MNRRRLCSIALALAALTAGCATAVPDAASIPDASVASRGAGVTVISHVTVVDVMSGTLLPDRTIAIRGDTIVSVHDASREGLAGARVIDGSGLYAIPGLWDMHVHVLWADSMPEALLPGFVARGVTGVRDMGGTAEGLLAAPALERAGIAMPRVVASGPVLDGPEPVDPSISFAVADSADAVAAVDSLHALGADFVKVYTLLPPDAFFAAAARARELGLPLAGHLPGDVSLADAAAAGMRSIEHLREEIEVFCHRAEPAACADEIATLRAHDVWQTPTLVVIDAKTRMREPSFAAPAAAEALPPVVREMWQSLRASRLDRDDDYWAGRQDRWRDMLWLTGFLHRSGVPILAGTDTPVLFTYPGESLHRELELLVEAGLAPVDALRAATVEPARWLERSDRFGAIEPGRAADIVLLEADPLTDIRATRLIAGVLLRGRWLDRAALDALEQ